MSPSSNRARPCLRELGQQADCKLAVRLSPEIAPSEVAVRYAGKSLTHDGMMKIKGIIASAFTELAKK